jgi:hypothetical protein
MNLKTPRDRIRWFGEFGFQAVAADSIELASAIEDFLRDYPLARGRRDGLRYMLLMVPLGRRMHGVRIEPFPPDGTTLEARIPVGRPVSRRAQLSTIGWALEPASTGTRSYTRRFIASDAAPTDIVTAVDEANRVLYGSRANDVRWSLNVLPRPEPGDRPPASFEIFCLLLSLPIVGILVVVVYVAVNLGVGWFVHWLGPLVARLFMGLIGLVTVGLGSTALFRVVTGRPTTGEYSQPQIVLASLFSVLLGLGFLLIAVLASDTTGF